MPDATKNVVRETILNSVIAKTRRPGRPVRSLSPDEIADVAMIVLRALPPEEIAQALGWDVRGEPFSYVTGIPADRLRAILDAVGDIERHDTSVVWEQRIADAATTHARLSMQMEADRLARESECEESHPVVCSCRRRFKTERGMLQHQNRSRMACRADATRIEEGNDGA